MYLYKVKDLEQLKLGNNMVLVEMVKEKPKAPEGLILPDTEDTLDGYKKEIVIKSTQEGIEKGDIVLDGRYALGQNGMLKKGERLFALAYGHDVKLWTKPGNFDENKTEEKAKTALDLVGPDGTFTQSELNKIQGEAKGLGSKFINNKQ